MAGKYLIAGLRKAQPAGVRFYSHDVPPYRYKIGNREVVGYGYNGEESYLDVEHSPCPAVRFKEVTPEIKILREKEKGDWKKLSIAEKKELYRASFCRTFAELNAPTGEWKSILGCVLAGIGLACLTFAGIKTFVYSPLPPSFDQEHQTAQWERIRQLDMNPINGWNRRH